MEEQKREDSQRGCKFRQYDRRFEGTTVVKSEGNGGDTVLEKLTV